MQPVHRFLERLRFVYPLNFESGDESFPYYCGGTCFAATFKERLFILTAKHCLTGRNGDPCVVGPDYAIFPLRQPFTPVCEDTDSAWSDVMLFSTYDRKHWPTLGPFNTIDLDNHIERQVWADEFSFLVILGYPTSLTKIEIEPLKILRAPSFHIGLYGGPTNDRNCHYFEVLHPITEDLDGLSGSPVLKIDLDANRAPVPTLLGVVTQANKEFIRFVSVGVILRMLRKATQKN